MRPLDYIMRKNSKEIRNFKKSKEVPKSRKPKVIELVSLDARGKLKILPGNYLKIRKYFIIFATNRSNFLSRKIKDKISLRKKPMDYSHRPKINKKSRKIVKTLHSKLSELKIPHYELLLYKGKEYEKRKEVSISEKHIQEHNEIVANSIHGQGSNPKISTSRPRVAEYDTLVVTKKPEVIQEYLDPKLYESSASTPPKSNIGSTGSEEKSGYLKSIISNGQLDKSELFNTSPIPEEEYS